MTTIIQKSAVIVRLNIRMCGLRRQTRTYPMRLLTTSQRLMMLGVMSKNFRWQPILKDIKKVRGKARNVNKAQTLPYLDGRDLLPVPNFDKHSELMTDYKDLFDALCEDFFAEYETHRVPTGAAG